MPLFIKPRRKRLPCVCRACFPWEPSFNADFVHPWCTSMDAAQGQRGLEQNCSREGLLINFAISVLGGSRTGYFGMLLRSVERSLADLNDVLDEGEVVRFVVQRPARN